MPLNPQQALALTEFTDYNKLIKEYLDEFAYRVLFDPTNASVSDFTPTAAQRTFILAVWNETRPDVLTKLAKIVKFIAVDTVNTATEVINLLRAGSVATTNVVFGVFKTEIPKLVTEEP